MDETILQEAQRIIAGAREQTHGPKERSFEAIAHLWRAYLETTDHALNGEDVAWMMVLMKIARRHQGTPIRDHFVDAAGYTAIAHELSGIEE